MSGPTRTRVRTDLELLADGKVRVVVECKRPEVPLSERVEQQAIEYAIKSKAKWIWTTNGKSHRFLKRRGSKWYPVNSLDRLGVLSESPVSRLEFPEDIHNEQAVAWYWRALGDKQFSGGNGDYDRELVLAAHRMLFNVQKKLPYSHDGVHILEDRGSAWHRFGNAGGHGYHTRYADFIAATQGRVEAVSVAVNRWHRGGLRLCVGVRKPNRAHHALQLDTDQCEYDEETNFWHIYHTGRMAGVITADVMEAVWEAQNGEWITMDDDGNEWIYLGQLPGAETATWSNCRELLANLIHYAIIRTNLREAHKQRSRSESNSNT